MLRIIDITLLLSIVVCIALSTSTLTEVRIGGFFPMRTTSAGIPTTIASQYVAAVLMAIKEINDKNDGLADNLLPNTRILFAIRFPRQQYLKGISTALSLSEDVFNKKGVHACVGPAVDAVSKSTTQVLAQFKIPTVAYFTPGSQLSYKNDYPYFMRSAYSEANDGRVIANLVSDTFGWTRVTVFYTSDPYGINSFLEFSDEAAKHSNLLIASSHVVGTGSLHKNLDNIITSAISMRTTIFVFLMDVTNAATLLQDGYTAGLFQSGTQILGGTSLCSSTLWQTFSSNPNLLNIMKGFICLSIAFNTTSDLNQNFVKRWRAQPNTVDIHNNGLKTCNFTTDDDGNSYLYKDYPNDNKSLPLQCTGLVFSSFAADGSDIYSYVRNAYDTVYALAYGFHDLIHTQEKSNFNGDDLMAALVNNVSFTGLTGLFEFSKGLDGYGTYGRGDRSTGLLYAVMNFHTQVYLASTSHMTGLVQVGVWSSEYGFVTSRARGATAYASIEYNTEDNSKPSDTLAEIYKRLSKSMKMVIMATAILCFVLVLVLFLLVYHYRKTGVIKASQPAMIYIILFGGAVGAGRILNACYDVTDTTCLSGTLLGHMTFVFIFNSLLVKTWRVHKLVNSKLRKTKITTKKVVCILLSCAVLVMLYIMTMLLVSPPQTRYSRVETTSNTLVYMSCGQDIPMMTSLLFVFEGLSLVVGVRLCWATRNVPDAINESKYVAIATYVVFFVCLLLFPLTMLIQLTAPTQQLVVALGFGVCIISCLSITIVPKMLILHSGKDLDNQLQVVDRNISAGGNSVGADGGNSVGAGGRGSVMNRATSRPFSRHNNHNDGESYQASQGGRASSSSSKTDFIGDEFGVLRSFQQSFEYLSRGLRGSKQRSQRDLVSGSNIPGNSEHSLRVSGSSLKVSNSGKVMMLGEQRSMKVADEPLPAPAATVAASSFVGESSRRKPPSTPPPTKDFIVPISMSRSVHEMNAESICDYQSSQCV